MPSSLPFSRFHGAWWYNSCGCGGSNLNGRYYHGGDTGSNNDGMQWDQWHGSHYSLKAATMKIRPAP